MALTQQESEVVDVLARYQELSGADLSMALQWGSSKLYPILAALEAKRAIQSRMLQHAYPRTKVYFIPEPNTGTRRRTKAAG